MGKDLYFKKSEIFLKDMINPSIIFTLKPSCTRHTCSFIRGTNGSIDDALQNMHWCCFFSEGEYIGAVCEIETLYPCLWIQYKPQARRGPTFFPVDKLTPSNNKTKHCLSSLYLCAHTYPPEENTKRCLLCCITII